MDLLSSLGRTLGFSFAAGINLYATVAMLGIATHFGWVDLPGQYRVFDNPWIIGGAVTLYVVEFVADKIPWVDTAWDVVHTAVRPFGGALIAIATLGDASPATKVMVGLLGAALATSTHLSKAGTRAIANASPEPFTNWALSFGEDLFVVGLGALSLKYPAAAAILVIVLVAVIATCATWIVRALRRRFGRTPSHV
jgi:hypothetical protein